MGRVKSLSNSGCFVLRKDNQNAKGEYVKYISNIRWIELYKTDKIVISVRINGINELGLFVLFF